MKQSVAILDFGTSKITVLIGSRGINDIVCIDGNGVCEYDGYSLGKWRDEPNLARCIGQALDAAQSKARTEIKKLYVGVPNEFSDSAVCDVTISLGKKRRVTAADIEDLKSKGDPKDRFEGMSAINIQPIFYMLDNEHKLVDPEDMVSTRLAGRISYTFARNDFIDVIRSACGQRGITDVEFVSSSVAEMDYLFDERTRDRGVILVDTGAIGSAFTVGQGDGILSQKFFDWGGLRITASLMTQFDLPFIEAEQLKRKVVLSLEPDYIPPAFPERIKEGDGMDSDDGSDDGQSAEPRVSIVQKKYEIIVESDIKQVDVAAVNSAVKIEIERLAKFVKNALKPFGPSFMKGVPLSITGGGLCTIRGATEYLSELIARPVEAVKPQQATYDLPWLSSPFGLLDFVLKYDVQEVGFFDRIKHLFSRR